MSGAPPFPSQPIPRRQQNDPYYPPIATLPLNVNRPPSRTQQSRPETPSAIPPNGPIRTSGSVPARPARSDLRSRLSASGSVPAVSRHQPSDSFSSARFQPSDEEPSYQNAEPQPETPRALTAAIAAFQSAGQTAGRRRAMTNGTTGSAESRDKGKKVDRRADPARMPRTNGRPMNDLDGILEQIRDDWSMLTDDEFNPVDVALSLLDSSSVGSDLDSFRSTKIALERSLKSSVDKYYQAFAASLPHHAALLTSLSSTQGQVSDARTRLVEVKEALGSKRADLVQLWSRGQALDEMLKLLDEIEHLKSIPDNLETLMTEKRLLQASVLLVKNLKTISKPDMQEVGAVSDLRSYLSSQEIALRDILIEELHNHLYLKTFWCDTRWAQYTPGQNSLPMLGPSADTQTSSESQVNSPPGRNDTRPRTPVQLSRFLADLAVRPTIDPLLNIEASTSPLPTATEGSFPSNENSAPPPARNPESDSFAYMETVLESLAVLGQLGYSLDVVAQRLPAEIHQLVDDTIEEVMERQEANRRASAEPAGRLSMINVLTSSVTKVTSAGALRSGALESTEKESELEILRDLFWTLYSKMDAVLQGMRVIYEVTNRISTRRDFRDSTGARPVNLFPLGELYQPVLAEVQTLLQDHLIDDDRGSSSVNPIASINENLRDGRTARDRTRSSFRFSEADSKASLRILKRYEDDLTKALKETVPGLVQGSSDNVTPLSRTANDDRFTAAEKHRRLIQPSSFHVRVLFKPTQVFLERVSDVLPPALYDGIKDENSLLDDFVVNVFLPQLEDKVSALVQHAISGVDAFEEDPASLRISPKPLIKACTQLMGLINSLCAMLRTTAFNRESYSRLILSVVIQFYQRCNTRFQDLVVRNSIGVVPDVLPDSMLRIAARWAQRAEVTACLSELYSTSDEDVPKKKSVCQQETRVELGFLDNDDVLKDHLIPLRNLAELCRLHHSITWFINQLASLRLVSEEPNSPQSVDPLAQYFLFAKPSFEPKPGFDQELLADNQLRLPLTRAMALRFDALLKTYDLLAEVILFTTRVDIRCRTIHYLDSAMRTGMFQIEHEPFEPDMQVIELNADMGKIDDYAANTLPERERRFLFEGLGSLIDQLLVTGARHVNLSNEHGVEKVMRNLLALEQNLKSMTGDEARDADLSRARKYWALFMKGPRVMLDEVHRSRSEFTFDEYKDMLRLQCGVELSEASQKTGIDSTRSSMTENADRRAFNEYLIELHALAIEDW